MAKMTKRQILRAHAEAKRKDENAKTVKVVMLTFKTNGNPVPIVIRMQLHESQDIDMNTLRLLFDIERSLNAIQSDVRTHIDLIEEEA